MGSMLSGYLHPPMVGLLAHRPPLRLQFGTMSSLDANHRTFLEHELTEVDQQIADLVSARSYLRRRLGLPDAEGETNGQPGPSGSALVGGDLMGFVNPGQYGGMSGNNAAAELLEAVGRNRPLTTREIYDAITKGGVKVKDAEVLAKMMKRSGRFHRPVPRRWGLIEWYPNAARAKGSADTDDDDQEPHVTISDEVDEGG